MVALAGMIGALALPGTQALQALMMAWRNASGLLTPGSVKTTSN